MIFNAQADTSRDEKMDASTYYQIQIITAQPVSPYHSVEVVTVGTRTVDLSVVVRSLS